MQLKLQTSVAQQREFQAQRAEEIEESRRKQVGKYMKA